MSTIVVTRHPGAIEWLRQRHPALAAGAEVVPHLTPGHVAGLAAGDAVVCVVADGPSGRDGRLKVVCLSGSPDQIRAFCWWAREQGLTGIYGDPARGFAGGYRPAA